MANFLQAVCYDFHQKALRKSLHSQCLSYSQSLIKHFMVDTGFSVLRRLCDLGGASPRGGCVPAKSRRGVAAHCYYARKNLLGFLQALAMPAHLFWQTLERQHRVGPQTAGRFGEEAVEVREESIFYGPIIIRLAFKAIFSHGLQPNSTCLL